MEYSSVDYQQKKASAQWIAKLLKSILTLSSLF